MNLKWYDITTGISLIAFVFYIILVIVKTVFSPREIRIRFLRDFKKGRFSLVYIFTYPLLYTGVVYGGKGLLNGIFIALKKVIDCVVLKFDYSNLAELQEQSLFYNFTLHIAFCLIVVNALMFTFSIFGQYLSQVVHAFLMFVSSKNKLYIFGERKENANIYLSEKSPHKLIIGNFSDKEKDEYYIKKIFYRSLSSREDIVAKAIESVKRGEVSVVINCKTQEENINICLRFKRAIEKLNDDTNLMKRLKIFVFGHPDYEEIYFDIVKNSKGCIHYINRYQQIAVDFIENYPITSFMDSNHIDYQTGLIKDGVDINLILLGFGHTNKQLFLTSVANNQFMQGSKEDPKLKIVNYYLFDKDDKEADKNLNHNYNRFKNEVQIINQDEYLPLPPQPANKIFKKLDINSPEFYKDLKKIITANKNSVNIVIIALGGDLQNIDLAKKLCIKGREWNIQNCTLFIKCNKGEFSEELFKNERCYFIGNNEKVFNIEDIICDRFTHMAMLRNNVYDLEYLIKKDLNKTFSEEELLQIKENSNNKWFLSKTQFERESSLYCCLSLRSKLNLIGLDCCSKDDERKGLSEKEFFDIYAKNDKPNTKFYNKTIDGKSVVKYSTEMKTATVRRNLAKLEHHRWNSFMITKGFVPASKEVILNEKTLKDGVLKNSNGKNYEIRRHGNITTFEGLEEYMKMIAERDSVPYEQTDVISYDYQIMDDAFWLLDKVNMKIVKRADFDKGQEE